MLNRKQEAFCREYAKTANGADAYKKAGYKVTNERSAASAANRLLQNVDVKNRLNELTAEARTAAIADIAEIRERFTAILRGEVQEEQIVVEGCGDGVSEAVVKKRAPQLKDMIRAGELLAKMQGGFDNSLTVNVVPMFGGADELED